jgi:LAS superfamily LD-carboxypeptidase LdcB
VLLGLTVFFLARCGGDADYGNGPNDGLNNSSNSESSQNLAEAPERKPFIFCGDDNPEHAELISDEEALSYLAIVNRCFRVSSEFSPDDLSAVEVKSMRTQDGNYHLLRETAARAAEKLFQAASDEGLTLIARSGYRSYDLQTFFHTNVINELGVEEGRRISAVPGHSEHQLGLALDVSSQTIDGALEEAFSGTPEGMWLGENAYRFGFIIRYPNNREADTGYVYEPWHIRYVGVEAATVMFNSGQILEEFVWNGLMIEEE